MRSTKYFAYGVAWASTALAVCFAINATQTALPLLAFIIPMLFCFSID